MESNLIDLEGSVESIVFSNSENHYTVARFFVSATREIVTIRGTILEPKPGESLRVTGQWQEDSRFGLQFVVRYFQPLTPRTLDGIRRFLGSGLIPGIGTGLADRIVDHFGLDTFRVIEAEPARLGEVDGIGTQRAEAIREHWVTHKIARDSAVFLRGHGLKESQANKVLKAYGVDTISKVQQNPYALIEEVSGIGFKTADGIARALGEAEDSQKRLRAGLWHCLIEAQSQGHTALEPNALKEQATRLLEVSMPLLERALQTGLDSGDLVLSHGLIQERMMATVESQIALRVATLIYTNREGLDSHISIDAHTLSILQKKFPEINLSSEQYSTLRMACSQSLSIITGGPGVGKTTILKILTHLFVSSGCKVKLCAPTGKASRRLAQVTGHQASTLHRLLQYRGAADFGANEQNPLDGDVFIVDEVSMLDVWLFHALLKALPAAATLVLVGDVDQLPSVGPGHVLRDLIQSEKVPVSCLRQIFRQGKESGIVTAAHRINSGNWSVITEVEDFYLVEAENPAKAREILGRMLMDRIPKRFGFHPVLDVQVLSPVYRGDGGIEALNRYLQEILNPHEEDVTFGQKLFRAGDKVMQLENNYDKEVFNGDQGVIEAISADSSQISVRYDERVVTYTRAESEELSLSYVASVHKVQGSEFPCVILILFQSHHLMLRRNLVYTAVTRGKQLVIVLGQSSAFERAIREKNQEPRATLLKEKLVALVSQL